MNVKRKLFISVLMVIIMVLSACGSKWEGTYGGTSTSGNKIEITINKDGSVTYERNGDQVEGDWTKNDNSIELDFNQKVSSKSEPLIVTLSSDEQTIIVESKSSSWNADEYQRR